MLTSDRTEITREENESRETVCEMEVVFQFLYSEPCFTGSNNHEGVQTRVKSQDMRVGHCLGEDFLCREQVSFREHQRHWNFAEFREVEEDLIVHIKRVFQTGEPVDSAESRGI